MRVRPVLCLVIVLTIAAACAAQQSNHATKLDALAAQRPAKWLPVPVLAARAPWVAEVALGRLASADPALRQQAAFLLGDVGYQAGREPLVALLADPVRQVRMHAGIALCRLGDTRGLKTAAAVLGGAREWMKYYATVGLWRLGTREAEQALEDHAYGQPPLVREAIAAALGQPASSIGTGAAPAEEKVKPEAADWSDVVDAAYSAFVAETDWWWHRGVYDQCVRCNDVLTFFDPQSDNPYADSAWLLWSEGRHTRAIGMYHRCIDKCTVSNQGAFHLGFYYLQHKMPEEAEPYLGLAVKQDPSDDLARRVYAHCLEKLGRLTEAVRQWKIILLHNPSDGAARLNLGRLQKIMKMGDPS